MEINNPPSLSEGKSDRSTVVNVSPGDWEFKGTEGV